MRTQSSWSEVQGAQLIQLASDKSQKGRALLTTAVVELFSDDNQIFSDSDHEVMTEIILKLVESVETSVKSAIAERLSENSEVPRDLIVAFANMESKVAFPVLKNSPVLKDPDLISVVMHKTMEHQMAVSMRTIIPAAVSRALGESEYDEVIQSLLENPGAEIGKETYESIAKRSSKESIFNKAMVERRDLPKSVAKQLYWAVSAVLRQELVGQHGIDEDSIDDAIEDVVPEMIDEFVGREDGGKDIAAQVEAATRKGVLGKVLVALLQSARIADFTSWLATASHLREELVNKIMFEEGGECLAAVFKAIGIGREDFLSMFVLLRQGRLGYGEMPKDEVQRVSEFFEQVKPDRASTFLKRLQRNPEYLNAIRTINPDTD